MSSGVAVVFWGDAAAEGISFEEQIVKFCRTVCFLVIYLQKGENNE